MMKTKSKRLENNGNFYRERTTPLDKNCFILTFVTSHFTNLIYSSITFYCFSDYIDSQCWSCHLIGPDGCNGDVVHSEGNEVSECGHSAVHIRSRHVSGGRPVPAENCEPVALDLAVTL